MTDDAPALTRLLGDRYAIERLLGRGGMGSVYLARDRRLDRLVALKVLPPEFAADTDRRERFLRETRMAAGFSHPNIVPVFAVEEAPELLAFVMGFVEGESLAARVARDGPLSRRDGVRLLQDVAYALAYAHGRGVVHRDIKPDNVMIERATGRALVMDFGIARTIAPPAGEQGLTRIGEVVGTPEYMSPEQACGDTVDGRSDLYALGLVAWFALTGRTAVTGESTQRILARQLTEPVPPLAGLRPDLPSALCEVVDRCCAKAPEDRFATAEALVEALDATQLATPEIPVPIRLLAPELGTVGFRTVVAVVLLTWGGYRAARTGTGNILVFGLIAAAAAWVAGVTTVQEIRRLVRMGFGIGELQRFLALTQAERDEVRALRAADTAQAKGRRRRVIAASLVVLYAVVRMTALLQRTIADGDVLMNSRVDITTFYALVIAGALGAMILINSPFRRPLSEQLFSAVWLGGLGRGLLRVIGGRAARAGAGPTGLTRPPGASAVTSAPARLSGAVATAPPPAAAALTDSRAGRPVSLDGLATDFAVLRARVDRLEGRERQG